MPVISWKAVSKAKEERVEIDSNKSAKEAVEQIKPLLCNKVVPFLDAHKSLSSIDHVMNGGGQGMSCLMMEPDCSMHAIIIAHLVRNPNYDRLVARYRDVVKQGCGEEGLIELESLVKHLQQLNNGSARS